MQDMSACRERPSPAPLLNEDALSREQPTCRLCFDTELDDDTAGPGAAHLLTPCDCSGTMRWVHRECLNQWRYHGQTHNPKAMTHCTTCDFEYRLYCTFNMAEDKRRKGKRRCRFARDFLLVFMSVQLFISIVACIIREFDSDQKISALFGKLSHRNWTEGHWWKDFFAHHFFHYYSAAFLLILFLIGIGTIVVLLAQCCCPRCFATEARAPQLAFGRQRSCLGDCCTDCNRTTICYDPYCFYGCDGCSGADCAGCTMDGEGALVLLGMAVVAIIFLGLFVALFLFSAALQRMGQRYLRVLHLKDVAERYAVLSQGEEPPSMNAEMEAEISSFVPTEPLQNLSSEDPDEEDGRHPVNEPTSQDVISAMLKQEIATIRGYTHEANQ